MRYFLIIVRPVLFILILYYDVSVHAQLLQNEWRDHLSYRSCYRIADIGDWVYCATQTGLISYNKSTYALRKHSKVTGLSDVLVSAIAYSSFTDYLVVGYSNGNIDLLREGEEPINLSDIKRKIITADKKIYDIYIKDHLAYLACGFGIVVINLEQNEIQETYFFGENGSYLKINDITIIKNYLYAATETGIYQADLASENLLDYKNWIRLNFIPQYMNEYKQIETSNQQLYAVYNELSSEHDKIIIIDSNGYRDWNYTYDTVVNRIRFENNYLTISCPSKAYIYDQNNLLFFDFIRYGIQDIYVSPETEVFAAATYSGFTKHTDSENLSYLTINGPWYNVVNKVSTFRDHVWVSSGGPYQLYTSGAAHSFIDGRWTSYTSYEIHTTNPLGNIYKIAIDPHNENHVYLAAYGYGLIEILDDNIINITELHDLDIFSDISDVINLRISGIQFDADNNLWIILSLVSAPLFKIDEDNNWSRPEIPSQTILAQNNVNYADLLITSHNQIWVLSTKGDVVVLEDDGSGNFESVSFNVKNQYNTQATLGYCLEEDNEGNVWVGSNNGPFVYYSPYNWNISSIDDIKGYQIPIPRNDGTNNVDLLLYNNAIYDIEVDGGNRKWFGTDNSGVFLTSSDGREIIYNFREDNSPMLSNLVTGIGINELSGEVFFATDLGLLSFGGTATTGLDDYSQVYVYPNPVRPDYQGNITISGLIENSIVKITDVSGNLVWETKSLGGQAIWNGYNFDGKRVATGVYLVLLSTEDGSVSYITKLLFIH